MTFLTPFIMVGLIALIAYLSSLNSDEVRTISILDESGLFSAQFKDTELTKYKMLKDISLEDAKKMVEESENYGLLYIPETENIDALSSLVTFYSEESPSLIVLENIEDRIEEEARLIKYKDAGIDPEQIEALEIRISARQETFKGEETSKFGSVLKIAFGGIAGYLLFMFIIIYGAMIMRSVIEEKTSRIIEIIISSVKPIKLLLGKIIGTSLVGISQFVVWIVLGSILIAVTSLVLGIDTSATANPEILNATANNPEFQQTVTQFITEVNNLPLLNLVIMFILFFIGGYLLYASLYAAIGAAVDNETDTQQFMMPIMMPLIIGMYVGFFTVIENPHGSISQVFSYIPFTSPVVMLMRIPFGVPLWQQILSVVILFATFMGIVWVAAKIYRVGILMYGKKPSYKELWKWLKY